MTTIISKAAVADAAVADAAVAGAKPGLDPRICQAVAALERDSEQARLIVERLRETSLEPFSVLRTKCGLTRSEFEKLDSLDSRRLDKAIAQGAEIWHHDDFPERLVEAGAPPFLFVHGDPSCLHAPCIAIVGTRGASTYGQAAAQKFAEAFARAGVTVISGGAIGIDAAAHRGALDAGGRTVAVLASGIDIVQPPRHGQLFDEIKAAGCLASMYAVGAPAKEWRFRPRNSLIAALSDAVLMVEVPKKSGALHTSTAAADFGRTVFVVPSGINHESFRGSHALIRDGSTLVDHPDQVLEELGIEPGSARQEGVQLEDSQKSILGLLTQDALPAEKIAEMLGMAPGDVMAELTVLEIEGFIVKEPSGYALRP